MGYLSPTLAVRNMKETIESYYLATMPAWSSN